MDLYSYVVIPILIFLARIIDVSLGTIRVLLIGKGRKIQAAGLGFIEVSIWLLAIKEIMNHLDNAVTYLAYPAGFATGTYIGMLLEERLMKGKLVLRVIVKKERDQIRKAFDANQIQYTVIEGEGSHGASTILFSIIDRKQVEEAVALINQNNPKAFYSLEPIKYARDPLNQKHKRKHDLPRYFFYRKGK